MNPKLNRYPALFHRWPRVGGVTASVPTQVSGAPEPTTGILGDY